MSIIDFLTTQNKEEIAEDLFKKLRTFLSIPHTSKGRELFPGTVDVEFTISKENGKIKEFDNDNTTYSFNLDEGTKSHKFLKMLYSSELSPNQSAQVKAFNTLIGSHILKNHFDELRDIIKHSVLNNLNSDHVPIKTINIRDIEFVDYSAMYNRRTLKIFRKPEIIGETRDPRQGENIQNYIFDQLDLHPGKSAAQIVEEEIAEKNPMFDGIAGAEDGQYYLWDVNIKMFVDYSYSDEEILKIRLMQHQN